VFAVACALVVGRVMGRALMQRLHSPLVIRFQSERSDRKISRASWGGLEASQEGGEGRGLGWAWPKVSFVVDYQCKDDIWPKLSSREIER